MEIPYLRKLLRKVPGRKVLGVYRFLPVFFVLGATLEFTMINLRVGETNFYDTYQKKEAQRILEEIVVSDQRS